MHIFTFKFIALYVYLQKNIRFIYLRVYLPTDIYYKDICYKKINTFKNDAYLRLKELLMKFYTGILLLSTATITSQQAYAQYTIITLFRRFCNYHNMKVISEQRNTCSYIYFTIRCLH